MGRNTKWGDVKFPQWLLDELTEEFRKRAVEGTLSVEDKADFVCPIHGVYSHLVSWHIRKSTGERLHGCPKCARIEGSKKRPKKVVFRKYPQKFIDMLAHEEDKHRAIQGSLQTNEEVDFICEKHGIYRALVTNRVRLSTGEVRGGCPVCVRVKKLPAFPQWLINELAHEEDKEKARKGLLKSGDVVEFTCSKHGVYRRLISERIRITTGERLKGCPECGKEHNRETTRKRNKSKSLGIPQWLIDLMVNEEDKQRAREGTLQSHDKIKFLCSKHGIYEKKIVDCVRLSTGVKVGGCPECGKEQNIQGTRERNRRSFNGYPQWLVDELAHEEDKQRAREGTLLGNEKVEFVCPIHGIFKRVVRDHVNMPTGERLKLCPKCSRIKAAKKRSANLIAKRKPYPKWLVDELVHEEDKQRALSGELGSLEKVTFLCPKHGEYEQVVGYHIRLSTGEKMNGCPQCGLEKISESKKKYYFDNRPEYPQWFIDDLAKEEDKERARNREMTTGEKVLFRCSEGHEYIQTVSDHIRFSDLSRNCGCPICAKKNKVESSARYYYENRPEYPQWLIDELYYEEDKQRARSRELKTTEKVYFNCPTHGPYMQYVSRHIRLSDMSRVNGCPKCVYGTHRSKLEDKVLFAILGDRKEEYVLNNKGWIPQNHELDIIFTKRKLAVEINGSYWHQTLTKFSEYTVNNRSEDYHYNKFLLCKKAGIRLVNLYDVDLEKPSVKEFIKSLLEPKEKVYARDCRVEKITKDKAKWFCDKHHLHQSENTAHIFIGLFKNDELLSVMTFGKKRFKNYNNIYELVRYCVKKGITVIGGASKLLDYFEKHRPTLCEKLITYSDNDFFTGEIYQRLGFTEDGYTKSYYWYFRGKELNRYQTQLSSLSRNFPDLYEEAKSIEGNKEDYIMARVGGMKVYRCGNTRWVKEYK